MAFKDRPVINRPAFLRHPARCTLALIAENWLRLEQRWEDNPGFVAMTAAGSLGLLLIAAMLINAGMGWIPETPSDDEVAAESPDSTANASEVDPEESDRNESSADEILVTRSRERVPTNRGQGWDRDRNTSRSGGASDPNDTSDPFAEDKTPARPIVRRSGDEEDLPEADSDGGLAMANQSPQVGSAGQDPDDEANDDSVPDKPVVNRPLPEMRVASQPQVLKSLDIDEDEDENSTAGHDQAAETESKPSLAEPARLQPDNQLNLANKETNPAKPAAKDEPLDGERLDGERPQPKRTIGLVRGAAEQPVPPARPVPPATVSPAQPIPQDDVQWKQQRAKSVGESASTVAARQSRPVETRIVAAAPARPALVAPEKPPVRTTSSKAPLRIAISAPPSVSVGQKCQIEIRVTNTGSVAVHRLVVSAELPPGLVHDVSQSLEQSVETIAPGATYRALLRLRGEAVGEKTIRAEVESAERGNLQLSAKVRVTPVSETVTVTVIGDSDCLCAPLR